MTNEDKILKRLENHDSGPIPVELINAVIGLLPKILELIGRKQLRQQVLIQGKLIQIILQKNLDQDKRLTELEKKKSEPLTKEFTKINHKLDKIIMTNEELSAKLDALQAALDKEQEQITTAVNDLKTANEELKALISEGGTNEERQALADKIDSIISDLESTIIEEG